jgi:hypothetical protein
MNNALHAMLVSFELGTIVGCLGALSVAASIFAVYRALRDDKPFSREIAAILALPVFYGGGTLTWSSGTFIPKDDLQRGASVYFLMIMLTLIVINIFPGIKLVRWLTKNITLEGVKK